MSVYHSQFRGDIATFPAGKVTGGDDFPGDLSNHPYVADHESGDGHKGKPIGVISYQDGEFHCRVTAQNRDWHFRGLELSAVQDRVRQFFGVARGRITFKLDRAANLARYGEKSAIARL